MAVSASSGSPASAISKPGSMFFGDARSCKDWLKVIPLTNVPQAQQKLLDALRIMNRSSDFAPLERLTCLELLRDKVAFLLGEQRARYVGKTLPLSNTDMAGWNVSNALLTEMESGYRRCYQDAQRDDSPLGAHAALIIQRIVRYIGLGMLMAGYIYRRFDNAMWMRLHLQWIEAESRGVTTSKVKDSIGTNDGYSSVSQAYVAVMLGQLANILELSPREIEFVDAVIRRFAGKVVVGTIDTAGAPNAHGVSLAVDLLSNAGASFHALSAAAEHVRFFDVSELSKSLRRRAKKLSEGAEPATVDLPTDWSSSEAYAQLSRLHKLWCEGNAPRPIATIPAEADAIVAFGIAETHFFLSGDLFEQPGVKRELTRQEMSDIAMFGRVSESTIRARYAEFNYGSETWPVVDESRGQLRVLRPANSTRGVAIGRLVGVRLGKAGEFYLSVVRELAEETPGHFTVTLALLPGKPEAISVRSNDGKVRSATYTQGFRLPPMESLGTPETLIVPSNLSPRGRSIDIYHQGHGSAKPVTVVDFVERGTDFDRVTIAG
jgi:hypothetical protein